LFFEKSYLEKEGYVQKKWSLVFFNVKKTFEWCDKKPYHKDGWLDFGHEESVGFAMTKCLLERSQW